MSFGYLTTDWYDRVVDIPFSLPETRLPAGSSVIVATLRCNLGQVLRLRVLNFHVVRFLTTLTDEVTTTVSANAPSGAWTQWSYSEHDQEPNTDYALEIDGMGLGYAGLFSADFSKIRQPTGAPLAVSIATDRGIYALNPHNRYDFSGPDIYHVVAVNNTNALDLDVVVTGSFRVYDLVQSTYETTLDGTSEATSAACVCCNAAAVSSTPTTAQLGNGLDAITIAPVGDVPTYSSSQQVATCPSGLQGAAVTVPAGTIISTVSQADADNQAVALANSLLICNVPGTVVANTPDSSGDIPNLLTPDDEADGTTSGVCNS